MSLGQEIIVSSEPKGIFLEGIIEGTPKPGTLMEVKPSTEPRESGAGYTFRVYQPGTNGERRPVMVLQPDFPQGKLATDAYVTGSWGKVYLPIMGELLNVLLKDISGTGDDFAIGAPLIAESGSGKLLATTGSPESEPFIVMETVTDPVADHLTLCMYTGY